MLAAILATRTPPEPEEPKTFYWYGLSDLHSRDMQPDRPSWGRRSLFKGKRRKFPWSR